MDKGQTFLHVGFECVHISNGPRHQNARLGDDVTFTCGYEIKACTLLYTHQRTLSVYAYVEWLKNDVKVDVKRSKYVLRANNSTLVLRNVNGEDAAVYKCRVSIRNKNDEGFKEAGAVLRVEGKLKQKNHNVSTFAYFELDPSIICRFSQH